MGARLGVGWPAIQGCTAEQAGCSVPQVLPKCKNMKHQVEFKGLNPTDRIRDLVENRVAHLDRLSRGIRDDALFLRCAVEEIPARTLFHVTVRMDVPLKTLAARHEDHDADVAIRRTFAEIETQLETYKSGIRREQWWSRPERRREVAAKKAEPEAAPVEDPRWFFLAAEPHLDFLRDVTGRMLSYLEARGDLPENSLEVDEVVDAALARNYDSSAAGAPENLRSRLVRFALEEIAAAVARVKAEREHTLATAERVPEVLPGGNLSTMLDGILDLYQADNGLAAETVLPDLEVPQPEEIAERDEVQNCVRDAIGEFSPEERRLLVLRYIVGFEGEELARSAGRPPAEVQNVLDRMRANLRDRLIASGCKVR